MKHLINILLIISFTSSIFCDELRKYKDIILIKEKYEIIYSNIDEINSFDISDFWTDSTLQRTRFGFIGLNYRRLDIKFLCVNKSDENSNKYIVKGKSRVNKNICEFQGFIEIKESYYLNSNEYFDGNSGLMIGEYIFYENRNSKNSGIFRGRFISYWNKKSNNFSQLKLPENEGNNQFVGSWTEYNRNKSIVANWGNFRIYNSGDLDVGVSEFGVNNKYKINGWESFINAHGGGNNKEDTNIARKEEENKWW